MTMNTTQTLTRPERQIAIGGPLRPRPDSSAGDAVLAYLRAQAQAMTSLEPRVRADEFDSVHQMRVATRRLRAALRTFALVIPDTDSQHLAGELQWLGRLLGQARTARCSPATATACARSRPNCSSVRSRPACKVTTPPGARPRTTG